MQPEAKSSDPKDASNDALDDALADSFPASDPVSITVPTVPGKPKDGTNTPPRGSENEHSRR